MTGYTVHSDYDETGKTREISIRMPDTATMDDLAAVVRMLFRAGMQPLPYAPADWSGFTVSNAAKVATVDETRVMHLGIGPEMLNGATNYQ